MSEVLDTRRSISEVLGSMTEQHKARWFDLNGVEPGAGFEQAVEAALDDGVDEDDVLASLVEAMAEESDDA